MRRRNRRFDKSDLKEEVYLLDIIYRDVDIPTEREKIWFVSGIEERAPRKLQRIEKRD